MLTNKKYVEHEGTVCPNCGDSCISGGSVNIEYNSAYQDIMCHHCGAEWTDVYELTGYDNFKFDKIKK